MAKSNYAKCKECGARRADGVEISWAGYCAVHGPARREAWNDALHYHRGEDFKRWRRAMAASVGAVLVDDVLESE